MASGYKLVSHLVVAKSDKNMKSHTKSFDLSFKKGSFFTMTLSLIITLSTFSANVSALTISSFNPILSDFAIQIGQEKITLFKNMTCKDDPHHFEPTPQEIKQVVDADLVLFAGKNLETFKSSVENQISRNTDVVEAGKYIPSLKVTADSDFFVCCPDHAIGAMDPHWWHSVVDSKRACQTIYKAMAKKDPANKKYYFKNLKEYLKKLDNLNDWAKSTLSFIKSDRRQLVTAHAAFAYFCRDFNFKSVPILGLSSQDQSTPGYIQTVIQNIREKRIHVVFPQEGANPKILDSIVSETGVLLGKPLLADTPSSLDPSYIAMITQNINVIAEAFQGER